MSRCGIGFRMVFAMHARETLLFDILLFRRVVGLNEHLPILFSNSDSIHCGGTTISKIASYNIYHIRKGRCRGRVIVYRRAVSVSDPIRRFSEGVKAQLIKPKLRRTSQYDDKISSICGAKCTHTIFIYVSV